MKAEMSAAPSDPPSSSSPFELRWRLFGIRFRIAPSYWIASAVFGWIILSLAPMRGSFWGNLALWILCSLVSVMVHELGHVIMGRIFGQPGDITLAALGGQASGRYEYLAPWQRILVAAAGPFAGFFFLGLVFLVDSSYWNLLMGWLDCPNAKIRWFLIDWIDPMLRMSPGYFQNTMYFLFILNLFLNLLNLLPMFPLDGGMILREVCTMISPGGGPKFVYGFSFIVAGLATLNSLIQVAELHRWIKPGDLPTLNLVIHPYFGVVIYGLVAYQNFALMRSEVLAQRRAHYQTRFDD